MQTLKSSSVKSLIIYGGMNDFCIDDLLVLLGTDGQGISHEIVNKPWVSLRKAVDSGKSRRFDDVLRSTGQLYLMQDVFRDFPVGKTGIVVMDCDPLAKSFMYGFAERVIEM